MAEIGRRDFMKKLATTGACAGCLGLMPGCALFGDDLPIGMVHGRIADGEKYVGLHPRFAKAFAWLRTTDLAALAAGRHTIDGDDIFANVMPEAPLSPYAADATMEGHRRYIDIQVPLSGPETYGYIYDETAKTSSAFDVEKDYVLFKNPKMRPITIEPGGFIIFFPPGGAHAPNLTTDARRKIRKLVIKVRF